MESDAAKLALRGKWPQMTVTLHGGPFDGKTVTVSRSEYVYVMMPLELPPWNPDAPIEPVVQLERKAAVYRGDDYRSYRFASIQDV